MSTVRHGPPISIEQYEHFEGYPGLRDELIHGEIVLSPQPKPLHQQVVKNVSRMLEQVLAGQPHTCQQNSNVRFPGASSMPAPDLFVLTKEQWNQACDNDDYLSQPPILVVEVLSPANKKRRVESKVEMYLGNGVAQVWVIHPKRRTVQVFGQQGNRVPPDMVELPKPLSGTVMIEEFFKRET